LKFCAITFPIEMKNNLQSLVRLDFDLTARIQKKAARGIGWRLAVILAHSGDSWVWAIGLGLVWLFSQGELRRYAAILEISVVIQALFVFALKSIIRRRRPSGEWGSLYRHYDPNSFPSGHATRAMLLAVMGLILGPAWFGGLLAIWAPLVCISRVMTGVHYISDILGGVVLGILMGLVMVTAIPLWETLFPFLF
jgi:membrane-associated phospholipid phosphatase